MQEQMKVNSSILERFEFRDIRQDEADQAVLIEKICFPPNEACSEKHMKERIGVTPELFLVAVDKTTGKLAGFLNGIATDEEKFRDEFFTDASLNNPKGKKVMILGLDVLPEYRGQGLAREIVRCYLQREEEKGRKEIVLTCLDEKVEMYKRFGCNGVQREHNKKLNNGLPILHKVPPKRDYGRYFCIMAEKGGTSHGGLTEKLSLFFHAKKQEVNAYGR